MGLSQRELMIAKELISFDTINPPGNEDNCASFITDILQDYGAKVQKLEFAPKRTSIVALLPGWTENKNAICFCGHIDTVPLGESVWDHDPFGGEVIGDKLYGRGASDMKSGLAAMIIMAERLSFQPSSHNVILVFSAGEETFCKGAQYIAQHADIPGKIGAMVVCEPTSNRLLLGHKGAIHLTIRATGSSAHASMPELGDNAIYKAADIALKLRDHDFGLAPHPLLGAPTLNVGTISGGININSVPDRAVIGVDIRTVPGQTSEIIVRQLDEIIKQDGEIELLDQATPVVTDPEEPWVREVANIVETITGYRYVPAAAPYFTDASVLTPHFGNPPTIIMGPGEPEQAHRTDEYCYISKIQQAVEIYTNIAMKWVHS